MAFDATYGWGWLADLLRDVGIRTQVPDGPEATSRGDGHVIVGRNPASVTLTSRRTASSEGKLLAAARA